MRRRESNFNPHGFSGKSLNRIFVCVSQRDAHRTLRGECGTRVRASGIRLCPQFLLYADLFATGFFAVRKMQALMDPYPVLSLPERHLALRVLGGANRCEYCTESHHLIAASAGSATEAMRAMR